MPSGTCGAGLGLSAGDALVGLALGEETGGVATFSGEGDAEITVAELS